MYIDIATIGDAVLDNYLVLDDASLYCDLKKEHCKLALDYAAKIPIEKSLQSVGGNAANVAVGCHLLGFNAALITELGDDLNGHNILASLKQKGIITKYIQVKKQKTRASVILDYKGERTILSEHTKRNYVLEKIPKSRWIYYTSLGASFEKIQKKLLSFLKKNPNTKLAVNPGSYQLKEGLSILKNIFPLTNILILNKEEAQIITGKKKTEKEILKGLLNTGAKIAVVTDGSKGAYATDGERFLFMPIYPLKSKSKTGAGDAFTSGFLSAIMQGRKIEDAMMWGTANSAGVIQEIGAQEGLFTQKEVFAMIKKYKNIEPKEI